MYLFLIGANFGLQTLTVAGLYFLLGFGLRGDLRRGSNPSLVHCALLGLGFNLRGDLHTGCLQSEVLRARFQGREADVRSGERCGVRLGCVDEPDKAHAD